MFSKFSFSKSTYSISSRPLTIWKTCTEASPWDFSCLKRHQSLRAPVRSDRSSIACTRPSKPEHCICGGYHQRQRHKHTQRQRQRQSQLSFERKPQPVELSSCEASKVEYEDKHKDNKNNDNYHLKRNLSEANWVPAKHIAAASPLVWRPLPDRRQLWPGLFIHL